MELNADRPDALPPPIVVECAGAALDALLAKEWLITNRIGAYASSTVVGCNTRKYHGLLVAAATPPVGRIVALSTVMEQLTLDGQTYDLATNEFPDAFSPKGTKHLREFRDEAAPTFIYRFGEVELIKRIILPERKNAVAVQYTLAGPTQARAVLRVRPFAAMRDFHSLRERAAKHAITFQKTEAGVIVQDRDGTPHSLYLTSHDGAFRAEPQWWSRFRYRCELARGEGGHEDLYSPGIFTFELSEGRSVQFNASLDEPISVSFDTTLARRRQQLTRRAAALTDDADTTTRRLAMAGDAFIARRSFPSERASATILAGYHWFADWGRDAFIALPGLLLTTGQFDVAREVFSTFAQHVSGGMIPNRFDDYSSTAHYNSIDASLWFIIAGERYLAATDDTHFWRDVLAPAARAILTAYESGTMFDIHADADGLLTGGSPQTQLTWMDAKIDEEVITPRHGKAVEINALWYCAHRILAKRSEGLDEKASSYHSGQGDMIASAFVRAFWNHDANCLYDCITRGQVDASIRPNQIFAVSLPYSPLSEDQQRGVLRTVTQKLLTPFGLRTLAPDDPNYRGVCVGPREIRDRAYHQGTVWAWLMGPYIEAYLKLEGTRNRPAGVENARGMLANFDEHLFEAGLGQISEIFDGDAPHAPRGCIAQAWSVGEILRAKQLVREYAKRIGGPPSEISSSASKDA